MKRLFLYIIFTVFSLSAFAQMPEMKNVISDAALSLSSIKKDKVKISIVNPNTSEYPDAPVCIKLPKGNSYKSAIVKVAAKETPSQMDDLNGDGIYDELVFVVSLSPKQKQTATISFSTSPSETKYEPRVHAQMWFKDKSKGKSYYELNHIPTDTVSEVVDNMYSTMYHHGPAFESDQAAYRVYFDAKESTDLYGKRIRQLELAKGMWYSSEAPDTVRKYSLGDDIILVGQTISMGTLRGWDDSKDDPAFAKSAPGTKIIDPCMQMIAPFKWRQAHIVTKGPVRTVVDMNVEGWQYKDKCINLKSRYILYAGNRECLVIQQMEEQNGKTLSDTEFVTGVMKVGCFNTDSTDIAILKYIADGEGLCASYGKDWPDGNHKLYPQMSTTGLAVDIPSQYITRTIDRKEQVLYGIKPIDNAFIYRMAYCAPDKETFVEKWTPEKWFDWCKAWKEFKPVLVKKK